MRKNRVHSLLIPAFTVTFMLNTPSRCSQEQPAALEIDIENVTMYVNDTSDPSALAKTPAATAPKAVTNFYFNVVIGDIVAVNGDPVKGTMVVRNHVLSLTPDASPGMAVADITRGAIAEFAFEILNLDGTQIGTIYHRGLSAGSPAPGSPPGSLAGSGIILGGTGPFIGAHGTMGLAPSTAARMASMTEDPSSRRSLGGGKWRYVLYLFPVYRPDIIIAAAGPGVYHSDWTAVTEASPARSGEVLIAIAKGLGPTRPAMSPGQMFPSGPFAVVTSPVQVILNNKPVQPLNQIGMPQTPDLYRIDFPLPEGTDTGMATIQLSAGWIKGGVVSIPVGRD